ncbi:MAG: hypothetical protein ACRD25_13055 [Terracidiphilus sp.]
MRKLLQAISLALMVAGAILLFERPAYAYADPGTGLLAIQALGSGLVAAGWYLRRKIHALFRHEAPAESQPEIAGGMQKGEGSPLP